MHPQSLVALALLALLAASPGCNRRIEAFDPDEKVEAPDLSKIFPPGAERAAQAEAAAAAGMPGGPMAGGPMGAPPPGASQRGTAPARGAETGAPIRGTIRLAPELEGRVPSSAVLFLVARSAEVGPPTAVKRIAAPRFPLDFEIGPGDRMIAGVPFSGPFSVSARVDADQNAMTRTPGDLSGSAEGRIAAGSRDVEIVIDEVL